MTALRLCNDNVCSFDEIHCIQVFEYANIGELCEYS